MPLAVRSFAALLILFSVGCAKSAESAKSAEVPVPAPTPAPLVAEVVAEAPKLKPWPDPARFEKQIAEFEAADAQQMPPEGAIVAIGSSSMRGWHKSIKADLAPLTVIPRGFGGSCMNDALHYVDRIVIKYRPRAVLLYEGDNDIAGNWTKEQIVEAFRAFQQRIHAELPETRIYVISIKPSVSRWSMWPRMAEANEALKAECAKDKRMTYIDVATPMLGANGEPKPEIFLNDNLHMKPEGYAIWTQAVKPVLDAAELKYETPAAPQ